MWFWAKVEALLLVLIRPFLSYKREDRADVIALKKTLRLFGMAAWRDVDDLSLGSVTGDELRRVIREDVTGFLWWGTSAALASRTITEIEIPAAIARARGGCYPVVPVFVDLDPTSDRATIEDALVGAERFLEFNGIVRCPREGRPTLVRRVANRYLKDSIGSLPGGRVTALFRGLSEPHENSNLAFDWRELIDADARRLQTDGVARMLEPLRCLREGLQHKEHSPELEIDSDLPLPLAFLVGYELRETTRVRLLANQRTGSGFQVLPAEGVESDSGYAVSSQLDTGGPVVLAVSCGEGFSEAAARYAQRVSAQELRVLHLPGILDAPGIRGLARATAKELRVLRDRGVEKHLLMLGPGALALFTGAYANAVGPVVVPFWHNASMSYVHPLAVGEES